MKRTSFRCVVDRSDTVEVQPCGTTSLQVQTFEKLGLGVFISRDDAKRLNAEIGAWLDATEPKKAKRKGSRK